MWSHDPRGASGTGSTQGLEPDTWEEMSHYLDVVYGRRTSRAQIQARYQSTSRDFTNNNQTTRNHDTDTDTDTDTVSMTAFYNASAHFSYLLEVRSSSIAYIEAPTSDRDSTELAYFLGTRWEFSGLTVGNLRLGMLNKSMQSEFDADGNTLEDFNGFAAEGSIDWTPQHADRYRMGLSRKTRESTEVISSYYISSILSLAWQHDFTSLFALNTAINYQTDEFSDSRKDTLYNLILGGDFSITERFKLGLTYTYSSRSSSIAGIDYTSNAIIFAGTYTPKW